MRVRVFACTTAFEREREREEKEKKTASTADRAVAPLRYPARSVFIIAFSVLQRLIAVPYGENKCTERGATPWVQAISLDHYPIMRVSIDGKRRERSEEEQNGSSGWKRRGWRKRNAM